MIVYSVTSKESYSSIEGWMEEIRKYTGEEIKVLLIGNKADLEIEREVSTEEGIVKYSLNNIILGTGEEVEGWIHGGVGKELAERGQGVSHDGADVRRRC